ncbi:hypothetical protein D9M69_604840 [compost metagenome]
MVSWGESTFFGTDPVADGCADRLVLAGLDLPPGVSDNQGLPDADSNAYIPRSGDRDAKDSGQYGVALRWFVPELNDTEFGAYAMNYHSRQPYVSLVRNISSLAFSTRICSSQS